MTIVKEGGKYLLKSKKNGKVLGKHASRSDAMKQEIAIKLNEAGEQPAENKGKPSKGAPKNYK